MQEPTKNCGGVELQYTWIETFYRSGLSAKVTVDQCKEELTPCTVQAPMYPTFIEIRGKFKSKGLKKKTWTQNFWFSPIINPCFLLVSFFSVTSLQCGKKATHMARISVLSDSIAHSCLSVQLCFQMHFHTSGSKLKAFTIPNSAEQKCFLKIWLSKHASIVPCPFSSSQPTEHMQKWSIVRFRFIFIFPQRSGSERFINMA